ncbi:MAG: YrzE family protein [Candidatus Thiodiazotropha sp.]
MLKMTVIVVWILFSCVITVNVSLAQTVEMKKESSATEVEVAPEKKLAKPIEPEKQPKIKNLSNSLDNNSLSSDSNSQVLQKEVAATLSELRSFLKSKQESPPLHEKLLTLLGSLATVIATLLGSYISYIGLKQIPFFEKNKGLIAGILGSIAFLVGLYVISGVIISVVYVFIAILVLILAIIVFGAQLISVIDEKYPEIKTKILNSVVGGGEETPLKSLSRKNIDSLESWLSHIVFIQQLGGDTTLELTGSLVEGFTATKFTVSPDAKISAHWKSIDDRMLVPVAAKLEVFNIETERSAEVLNFQTGLVVIKENDETKFERFNVEGFSILGAALMQLNIEKQKKLIEEQEKLRASFNLNESLSI